MAQRVIVVKHKSGALLKVCENRNSYNQWLDSVSWTEDELDTSDARVRPEE